MVIELQMSIHMEPGKPSWSAYEKWVQKLEQLSGGALKIKMSYSGIVGLIEWENVLAHTCDITRVFTLNMPPFPMHTVPALPYMLPDSPAALDIIDFLYKQYLSREWQKAKVLWLGLMSPWHLHTADKAVRTLEDIKGLRILASGLMAELVKAWGGIPVELTPPAGTGRSGLQQTQYNALKNGVVDGSMGTFEVVNDFKLYEVTEYHTYLNVFRDINATIMNLNTWNNLPEDIQQLFDKLNSQARAESNAAQNLEAEKPQKMLIELKHTMIKPEPKEYDRFVKAAGTMVNHEITRLDSAGVPASAIAADIKRIRGENE